MSDIYLVFVVLLIVLAVFDLMVGVSNDAVNFLNSAIGSKVARRNTIMVIATIGIFLGAATSSGMMEVARKGVFHPGAFTFEEIMAIFMAVMLTDIILLDLFNTFGMPTSTTVSIVFELLGAAVAVSLIKMGSADIGMGHISEFINGDKALQIVIGILLSVVVAFSLGSIIQYLSRIIFSFHYQKRMKWVGSTWASMAMTAMTWFLLTKGLKNASFWVETVKWINGHPLEVALIAFVGWLIIFQILISFTKVNIMQIVVLFGTFSLAMAFAGNDLVNFIGVPIAGLQSYNEWTVSGLAPDEMQMDFLANKIPTSPYLLFIAGAIMAATLWLSKKARTVTETQVKLGRQDEGTERFSPNFLSRGIVRVSRAFATGLQVVLPASVRSRIDKNFKPVKANNDPDRPAFDLIRATVNLAVASIIISYGSAHKLPLSTTYVAFMVAMGASLADRAWGRDSAVYRIAGVLNVVAGWFGTALAAFTVSSIFGMLIYFFGIYAVVGLALLAAGLILRSSISHRRSEKKKSAQEAEDNIRTKLHPVQVKKNASDMLAKMIRNIIQALSSSIEGLANESQQTLRKAREVSTALEDNNSIVRKTLYQYIRRIDGEASDAGRQYLKIYGLQQDLVQSITLIVNTCASHVENMHKPLKPDQIDGIQAAMIIVQKYMGQASGLLDAKDISEADRQTIRSERDKTIDTLDQLLDKQVEGVREELYGSRNSQLFFTIILEMRDMANEVEDIVTAFTRAAQTISEADSDSPE
ncbi:MAG TPA: inorganic phosphate transporter [Bacteroidetes bacterium]|nr:inorganic phosphate transporter [Bacteroidota bacterium]